MASALLDYHGGLRATDVANLRVPCSLDWFRKATAVNAAFALAYPWQDAVPDYDKRQSVHNQKWDRLTAWENASSAKGLVLC